jgi:hypothetical protein
MTCGPDAALEVRDTGVLRCPRCGDEQHVPALPLCVVTGASGTGKTTITGPLRDQLPDCEVFEADTILQVAALGWDAWRNTWLQLAHEVALNGRVTVLCGSLLAGWKSLQLAEQPGASGRGHGDDPAAILAPHPVPAEELVSERLAGAACYVVPPLGPVHAGS